MNRNLRQNFLKNISTFWQELPSEKLVRIDMIGYLFVWETKSWFFFCFDTPVGVRLYQWYKGSMLLQKLFDKHVIVHIIYNEEIEDLLI